MTDWDRIAEAAERMRDLRMMPPTDPRSLRRLRRPPQTLTPQEQAGRARLTPPASREPTIPAVLALEAGADRVRCIVCKAAAGEPCTYRDEPSSRYHLDRVEAGLEAFAPGVGVKS